MKDIQTRINVIDGQHRIVYRASEPQATDDPYGLNDLVEQWQELDRASEKGEDTGTRE